MFGSHDAQPFKVSVSSNAGIYSIFLLQSSIYGL